MALIGDLIEDDPTHRIADLAVHVTNLRLENQSLRRQRDRYRNEAERARVRSAQ